MNEFDPDYAPPAEFFACCEHCGCLELERDGHDDTCRFGCNDEHIGACWECEAAGE